MPIFESKWPNVLLWPFSLCYWTIASVRNWLYDRGIIPQQRLPCRIISIGNITVGGTGKTPTVELIARWLVQRNIRVCILSRGYGRSTSGLMVVSDGKEVLTGSLESGDEPYLLAGKLPGVPVLVDARRIRGAAYAVRHFAPEVILLDDAFQHRRIARDIDVVLLDTVMGFGNGWLLPAGPLRESVRGLKRAQLILFTRSEQGEKLLAVSDKIRKYCNAPCAVAAHSANEFIDLDGRVLEVTHIKDKRVLVFCGIGRPESFFHSVLTLGAVVVGRRIFRDHHRYGAADKRLLNDLARKHDAEYLVTTEKDRVRFSPEDFALPLLSLVMRIEIRFGEREFWSVLEDLFHS